MVKIKCLEMFGTEFETMEYLISLIRVDVKRPKTDKVLDFKTVPEQWLACMYVKTLGKAL